MKIGVMTFWWSEDNYGQLLQCYALQKYLRDLGHEAYLIRYHPDNDIVKDSLIKKCYKALSPKKLYNFAKNRINRKKLEIERKNNDRQFEVFRQKYIAQSKVFYSSLKELQANPPEADAYIVGSDQVWNFWSMPIEKCKNLIHTYFLDFGSGNTKRISYAASWGRTNLLNEEIAEITPLLKRFDYVSVREKNGIELCSKCNFDRAEWVCDPTLLLSAETYRKIYCESEIRRKEKKFLLLYMLGNECDFDIKTAYEFAAKKNIEVVYVSGNDLTANSQKTFATIPEWLYLVDNAEYVITNSFHCGVFSTIFHKQFGIVPLTGTCAGMNARLSSLFELTGIDERFVTSGKFEALDSEYTPKEIIVSEKFLNLLK